MPCAMSEDRRIVAVGVRAIARIVALPALLAGLFVPAFAEPDAQALVNAADQARNPATPFSVTLDLTQYHGGKQIDSNQLVVYSKKAASGGSYSSLVQFVLPARDAGKLILKNANDLWVYDPNNKASIRISPQERLLGQASNGDVVTANFSADYRATLEAQEDISDGEKKMRHCYRLLLKAAVADVTYDHMQIWIDSTSSELVKGAFFAESGGLLKTVYYRKFANNLGVRMPTEAVIIDGVDPGAVTVMDFSNYQNKNIPDTWFQRSFLQNFQLR
jgi:outer membrane lipoprotein-sorting protein